jgi:hypothetical protein
LAGNPSARVRLRISPHATMRIAPFVYLAAVLLLTGVGVYRIFQFSAAADAVIAKAQQSALQAAPQGGTQGAQGTSSPAEPTLGGNRSYIVKRTTQGSPVEVNVSSNPGTAADGSKAPDLSALKDKLDDLRWVLTLILAAAGLFTVVQGIAAGFSAQNFQKQAESAIRQLELESTRALENLEAKSGKALSDFEASSTEASQAAVAHLNEEFQGVMRNLDQEAQTRVKHLEELEQQVVNHYPLFEKDRAHAFSALRDRIAKFSLVNNPADGFDQRRRFYERIDLGERQEILAVDRALAYEIAGQNDPPEVFAEQTRQLAQFYWSKFIYEKSLGYGSLNDLERAEHLLEIGRNKAAAGRQFQFLNVLGNVRLERHKAKVASGKFPAGQTPADAADLAGARAAFEASIEQHPDQIRGYHNLAVIHTYFNYATEDAAAAAQLRKAARLLEQGLIHQNWETQPVPEFRCGTLYNLACVHARLAALDISSRRAECDAMLLGLDEAAQLGFVPEEDVEADYEKETGDFYPLLHGRKIKAADSTETTEEICDAEVRGRLLGLRHQLYRNSPVQQ